VKLSPGYPASRTRSPRPATVHPPPAPAQIDAVQTCHLVPRLASGRELPVNLAGNESPRSHRLSDVAPQMSRLLQRTAISSPTRFATSEIRCQTVTVTMRDGVRLATDVYLPPEHPAPTIAVRTPYGRGADAYVGAFVSFARRGYVVISQDCRGTGDSEPDSWDYYMYEAEDGYDLVQWISQQDWFDGFLGSCGGSYLGQTQWPMALHPRMSTIVPEVSGLGLAVNTARLHMFANAYARSVGKGEDKVPIPYSELEPQMLRETLSTGYFNEPLHKPIPTALLARFPALHKLSPTQAKRWLWEHYCSLTCDARAEFVKQALDTKSVTVLDVESLSEVFGHQISHDAHTLPHPHPTKLAQTFHTPILLRTGWYDWGLNDTLATWTLLIRAARDPVRSRCRLVIAPSAHNAPGYHEAMAEHPELQHAHGVTTHLDLLLRWYETVRTDTFDNWPAVIYYLMGANEWRAADAWPIPNTRSVRLHLAPKGRLTLDPPRQSHKNPDRYTYNPDDPTPTVGGSIVSYVYPPGSVDVSHVQDRPDVLTYTTEPFPHDVDVIGPLRLILYASSSTVDTDFAARLTDLFPDGRAIQLQTGLLRARFRALSGEPELLQPGRIYRLEIDMWATANRFKAGHCLRLDISSADFPRLDCNTNRGGNPGRPLAAHQTIYHDPDHPSHLLLPVIGAFPPSSSAA
jgi:uncharacterized protein